MDYQPPEHERRRGNLRYLFHSFKSVLLKIKDESLTVFTVVPNASNHTSGFIFKIMWVVDNVYTHKRVMKIWDEDESLN